MATAEEKLNDRKEFEKVFPVLLKEFVKEAEDRKFPQNAIQWIKDCLNHNVPGGKLNRGLSVVDTFKLLKDNNVTEQELFKARVLGWCVEWLQAFFLVADDIMDQSITRRGQPCWYKMEGVGNIAINDSFLLEAGIYFFLKKYFRQDPYYIDLLELFHEITLETEFGQLLDLTTAPEDHIDLSKFSIQKHKLIVLHKTAYYSFYLPVALAMRMTGIKDEKAYQQAQDVLLPLGEYFQIQALAKANPEQRKLLDENYGKKDPKNVEVIKRIYNELDLESVYKDYENNSYAYLNSLISKVDDNSVKHQFTFENLFALLRYI
ncbi:12404_t:CDS:10 [Entrophospora sp. SA101]|nr:6917_t:CDS:10 [Entrophospora sp. SA101]CAJ0636975.1 12404_t:CDS:10 [Entrophospora sp. SA101]CAJ0839549.1 7969_t:CDS:10 [Entrophospora sp. SA101]CAJ0911563.1 22649_t:CDS:10 [Entrophospora sp. SA101]CAJ0927411.1 7721_t:CDS:10 [Entrophospora sp. SA101]